MSLLFFAAGAVAGAALTPLLARLLARAGLARRNFAGEPVVAGVGLAIALPGIVGAALAERSGIGGVAAGMVAAFALLGLVDDRWGRHGDGGFRGHFRALRRGKVTTGALKALGGGGVALAAAVALFPPGKTEAFLPCVMATGLIALGANLLNLLDLRPLRALKAFVALGGALWAPLAGSELALALAALLGAALGYAPWEARRRVMLGDAGANALGAALGLGAALALPLWAKGMALAALIGVHLFAETHSLTAWIEAHPWARALDRWGWAPRFDSSSQSSGPVPAPAQQSTGNHDPKPASAD